MLWYKTWLETRWRFMIGLGLLLCSAAGVVFGYHTALAMIEHVPQIDLGGELGRRVQEQIELSREYRGYVWTQGFRQNLAQMGTLFAVLLGTGGLLPQGSGGGALFTLSLPASRRRLLAVRVGTGLAQWFALALVPALMIALWSPMVGESFALTSAIGHGLCLFVAGAVFFSMAVLLSTIFGDVWRPLLFTLLIAMLQAIPAQFFPDLSRFSLAGVMSGESLFRAGQLPWMGLLVSVALAAVLLYGAARNLERHDF